MTAAAVLVAAGASVSAHGQAPDIERRRAAAVGPAGFEDKPLWETTLVAGDERIVAVSNAGPRTGTPQTHIGYAVAGYLPSNGSGAWTWTREGIVPLGQFTRAIDPSIAYDPFAPQGVGEFVLAGLLKDETGQSHIGVTRYDVAAQSWSDWESLDGPGSLDKPWMVAGESTAETQEFYVFYSPSTGYKYQRTRDGWTTWVGGVVEADGPPVGGSGAEHLPAVYDDGPLYFAFKRGAVGFRFLQGTDNPETGGVDFAYLRQAGQLGRLLEVPLNTGNVTRVVPGHSGGWYFNGLKTVPGLAVDPTDPDHLYLAYHDTPARGGPGSTDVNIYLQVLTRYGLHWDRLDEPILVNNDDTDFESDQFLPSVVVDENGYIHIIFYDDRRYNVDSGTS